MGISKAAVWCVVAMLAWSLLVGPAMGKEIGYGAVGGGNKDHSKCKGSKCDPDPSNGYQRGCERADHCRSPPAQKQHLRGPVKLHH